MFPVKVILLQITGGKNPEHPSDVVEFSEIPSKILVLGGKESACRQWLKHAETDDYMDTTADALAYAALDRLDDDNGYGLNFYLNHCRLDGSTAYEDAYKKIGLTLY